MRVCVCVNPLVCWATCALFYFACSTIPVYIPLCPLLMYKSTTTICVASLAS